MVLCTAGIVVFGVLGIFSAKYRHYFRESLKCIKKTVMLRPCEMELEKKIRARTVSKLINYPKIAGFVYRHFRIISWVFVLTMTISLVATANTLYNIAVHGTCNPADASSCFIQDVKPSSCSSS